MDDMAVDKNPAIQLGNEAFKCKLVDRGKTPNGEHKTRLIRVDEALGIPVSVEVARQPRQAS